MLNNKQKKTLDSIFEEPVKANIKWNDIISLCIALGAEVSEGRGSRVRVSLKGIRAIFHRPHPERETDKGTVKSIRRFILEAGVKIHEL